LPVTQTIWRSACANLDRVLKAILSFGGVEIVLPQQQLAFEPMRLSLMLTVFMFIGGCQRFRQSI
jgi:hypothetical protein